MLFSGGIVGLSLVNVPARGGRWRKLVGEWYHKNIYLQLPGISIMVVAFTVNLRLSAAPKLSSLFRRYGVLAVHATDLTGWSDDYWVYFSFMHAVTMDPFHPVVVGRASGSVGVDVVDDYYSVVIVR
jgi:hypothetical protein